MRLDKRLIGEFSKALDNFHYEMLVCMMIGPEVYENPILPYNRLKSDIRKFDEDTQQLIAFFYMGEVIKFEAIKRFLGEELLQYLYDEDILNYDEDSCWLNNFLVIPYLNCYFVVSNTPNYPTCQDSTPRPYIGPDSYWLARNVVNKVKGKVLDLCTGSGIQAILAAKGAKSVIAVDIDPIALEVAKFNSVLNNVDDRLEFRNGDLYEAVRGETFDYILTNPPFIPIPEEIDFPICGDGGEDGKAIVNNLLDGYRKYLNPGGTGIMIGQALGNDDKVFLEDDVTEHCKNMKASLLLWGNMPISSLVGQTMILAKQKNNKNDLSFEAWEERFAKQGATELYTFTLFVINEEGNLSTQYSRDSWAKADIPVVSLQKAEKVGENYGLHFARGKSYSCDDEVKYFIEHMDGQKTVAEILAEYPLRYKVKHNASEWSMSASYLSLCGVLERMGIISKERRTVYEEIR